MMYSIIGCFCLRVVLAEGIDMFIIHQIFLKIVKHNYIDGFAAKNAKGLKCGNESRIPTKHVISQKCA